MTQEEWAATAGVIEAAWGREFDFERQKVYYAELKGYEGEDVLVAVRKLLHSGHKYLPTLSELLSELNADEAVPGFAEAWDVIRRAIGRHYTGGDADLRAEEECAKRHPLIATFAVREGWRELRTQEPTSYLQHARAERWQALVEEQADRRVTEAAALPPGGASRKRLGLAPVDFVAALEAGDGGD